MDILDELAKPEIPFQTLLDKRNYSLCMRHPQFYFSDGNVTFLVESVLVRVHRYFFQRDSPVFASMFSLPPPPGEGPEGASDEGPIVLEGVKLGDFERFLDFHSGNTLATEGWISTLKLASLWQFTSITKLSLSKLTKLTSTSPIDRIHIARQLSPCIPELSTWFMTAYLDLCTRDEPLNLEEGEKLGMKDVIRIGVVRHHIRFVKGSDLDRSKDMVLLLVAQTWGKDLYH
ncbi:hypothetical protein CC2G_008693 [Coprinopsis cinerea AmutBmut pab1-1]|nr:hypothetical protein CC2G_008693 [Coprinopsis cinerea AmutBmut pab1-1]